MQDHLYLFPVMQSRPSICYQQWYLPRKLVWRRKHRSWTWRKCTSHRGSAYRFLQTPYGSPGSLIISLLSSQDSNWRHRRTNCRFAMSSNFVTKMHHATTSHLELYFVCSPARISWLVQLNWRFYVTVYQRCRIIHVWFNLFLFQLLTTSYLWTTWTKAHQTSKAL